MSNGTTQAIIKTLCYADIFDYPLRVNELYNYLILEKKKDSLTNSRKIIKQTLKHLPSFINKKNGLLCLAGRETIFGIRKNRERESLEKLRRIQRVIKHLTWIPTVQLIGVSGALAVNNADPDDDIDLFIITTRNSVWLTRFLIIVSLEILGCRRRPGKFSNIRNLICLNMFVDEYHLEIPTNERDIFSAHEVIQMKPLFYRGDIYRRFLEENSWVKNYLPNAIRRNPEGHITETDNLQSWQVILLPMIYYFDRFFKYIQLIYMHKRKTNEIISEGLLRFHPHDARIWVLEKYNRNLSKFLL